MAAIPVEDSGLEDRPRCVAPGAAPVGRLSECPGPNNHGNDNDLRRHRGGGEAGFRKAVLCAISFHYRA